MAAAIACGNVWVAKVEILVPEPSAFACPLSAAVDSTNIAVGSQLEEVELGELEVCVRVEDDDTCCEEYSEVSVTGCGATTGVSEEKLIELVLPELLKEGSTGGAGSDVGMTIWLVAHSLVLVLETTEDDAGADVYTVEVEDTSA